tara:strand:+ start:1854 stop:2219 length:366 start_codon:yes stop_codon:yes gene_type:complete
METFHNATLKMIDTLKKLGQTDSGATIEVEVYIGVVISLLIFSAASVCIAKARRPPPNTADSLDEDPHRQSASNEDASEADLEPAETGAYRSDSDSDSDSEDNLQTTAREAQKRARKTPGV